MISFFSSAFWLMEPKVDAQDEDLEEDPGDYTCEIVENALSDRGVQCGARE